MGDDCHRREPLKSAARDRHTEPPRLHVPEKEKGGRPVTRTPDKREPLSAPRCFNVTTGKPVSPPRSPHAHRPLSFNTSLPPPSASQYSASLQGTLFTLKGEAFGLTDLRLCVPLAPIEHFLLRLCQIGPRLRARGLDDLGPRCAIYFPVGAASAQLEPPGSNQSSSAAESLVNEGYASVRIGKNKYLVT